MTLSQMGAYVAPQQRRSLKQSGTDSYRKMFAFLKGRLMLRMPPGVWALLLGIVLIMLGNGMHFTLIGLRGGIEDFSATELAIVTSGYFLGFLSGARYTPALIRRVGHVRVFAALGSFMSAGLIAFPLLAEPWAWTVLRLLVGFCMSGIYVAAESWLNNASTNETRGKVLSAYMIAQTLGIIGAQALLTLGDAGTSSLFIGASILVSISFAPILLSVTPVPAAEVARPMSLRTLFIISPLGTVGIFLLGGVYAGRPPTCGPGLMLVYDGSWRYGGRGRRSWSALRSRPQDSFRRGRFVAQR